MTRYPVTNPLTNHQLIQIEIQLARLRTRSLCLRRSQCQTFAATVTSAIHTRPAAMRATSWPPNTKTSTSSRPSELAHSQGEGTQATPKQASQATHLPEGDEMTNTDDRIREFTTGALAALTDTQRTECKLLAQVEPGMRLHPHDDDPSTVELVWGGAVIGLTTWAWLNDGIEA